MTDHGTVAGQRAGEPGAPSSLGPGFEAGRRIVGPPQHRPHLVHRVVGPGRGLDALAVDVGELLPPVVGEPIADGSRCGIEAVAVQVGQQPQHGRAVGAGGPEHAIVDPVHGGLPPSVEWLPLVGVARRRRVGHRAESLTSSGGGPTRFRLAGGGPWHNRQVPDDHRLLTDIETLAATWAGERAERIQRRHLDPDDFEALAGTGYLELVVPVDHGGRWRSMTETGSAADRCRSPAGGRRSRGGAGGVDAPCRRRVLDCRPPVRPSRSERPGRPSRLPSFATALDGHFWGTITSEPGSGG